MSKPCIRCIEKMNSALDKGYKIDTIYYSNANGQIEKCSLNYLNSDPEKHVSRYFRRHIDCQDTSILKSV